MEFELKAIRARRGFDDRNGSHMSGSMGGASTTSRPESAPASTFGAEMINSSGDLENATNPSGLRAEFQPQ